MNIRWFEKTDIPALAKAIESDKFHPGEWKVEHFYDTQKDALADNTLVGVIEDSKGPVTFVRYTKTLRISCVWSDSDDTSRNARAIVQGLKDAVKHARQAGFTEIIITTNYPKLAEFFTRVVKMVKSDGEYLLYV